MSAPEQDVDHDRSREMLGAHALGHLDRGDARRVRRHVARCAECRAELAEIAPVAEQLVRLRPEDADREARRRRRARRRSVLVPAAALVAAVVVGVVGARVVGPYVDPGVMASVPVEEVALTPAPDAERLAVSDAGLIDHTWGVELQMTGSGFADGEVYRVRFMGVDGEWAPAGRFVGIGEGEVDCAMQSGLLRRDAVAVQVLDADDEPVLVAEL